MAVKNTIENKIRLKIVFIYIIIALVFCGILYYIYNFRNSINEKKDGIDNYNTELILINKMVASIQQAQYAANMYTVSNEYRYLREFQVKLDSIDYNLDSLSKLTDHKEQYDILYEITTLLKKRKRVATELNYQFKQSNIIEPIYEVLQNYDSVIIVENPVSVTTIHQDTIINIPEKKNFWKRLGEVFSPEKKSDTTLSIITTKVDTIVNVTQDSMTIISDIKQISEQINETYTNKISTIERHVSGLILSDQEISGQISDLLTRLHQQTLNTMIDEINATEQYLDKYYRISIIGGISIMLLILIFIFLIINDVNRGYKARKDLEISKKKTEELMTSRHKLLLSVSHDIKSPLTSIMGYLDIWKSEELSPEELKRLNSMQNSGKHILSLLTNLLEFSRLEQQNLQISNTNFEIKKLCDEVVEMFNPLAIRKNLCFNYRYDIKENLCICSDYLKIKQILTNVLSNSVKYTLDGEIKFLVSRKDSNLRFIITDTGVGIPEDKIQDMFRPFTRVDGSSNIADGSGFGMYVVKGLVDLMKGKITVSSQVGKGTSVEILIPYKIAASINSEEEKEEKIPPCRKLRILVIDDDMALLSMLKEMLLKLGHIPEISKNIDEFEQYINAEGSFDFILTDMEMGIITGKDILKKVKMSGKNVPVLIMTAASDYDGRKAKGQGFSGFIRKPFSMSSISKAFNRFTDIVNYNSLQKQFPLLDKMFEGDEKIINEVIKIFIESTKLNIELLERAVSENDFGQAKSLCHKMLPMFLQLEEYELAEILKKMDSFNGNGETEFPEWKTEISGFISEVKLLIENLSGIA